MKNVSPKEVTSEDLEPGPEFDEFCDAVLEILDWFDIAFTRTPEEMNFAYAAQRIRELAAALPDPILDDAEISGIVNAISNQ